MPRPRAVPHWPARLRCGAPQADCGGVLPCDPELSALRAGLRRLIKREALSEEDAGAARDWLLAAGLRVKHAGEALLASDDQHVVDQAVELEARASDRDAQAELGRLLGYPACCIERFTALELQDDVTLFDTLLPSAGTRVAAEVGWLVAPIGLISHAPCSHDCAPSYDLATAVRERLAREQAGWHAAWERLARRLQIVTADARALSVVLDGQRVSAATEIVADAEHPVRARDDLLGRRLFELEARWSLDQR